MNFLPYIHPSNTCIFIYLFVYLYYFQIKRLNKYETCSPLDSIHITKYFQEKKEEPWLLICSYIMRFKTGNILRRIRYPLASFMLKIQTWVFQTNPDRLNFPYCYCQMKACMSWLFFHAAIPHKYSVKEEFNAINNSSKMRSCMYISPN